MLALDPRDIYDKNSIILKNKRNGCHTFSKAYSTRDKVMFELFTEKNLGVFAPMLHLRADGINFSHTAEFSFDRTDGKYDVYILEFDVSAVCGAPSLLFYKISYSVGDNRIYFCSRNNVDGYLTYDKNARDEFKMLIYSENFETPKWFHDCVMYHVFVDRFCKGEKKVPVRDDAVINDDWYGGVPQYGNLPGDFCANNMFFGGTLWGIIEKLDYLQSLGVNVLYLSPIFEAYSNHKYDTGDYSKVDEMFGGDKALEELIAECNKRGMHIILDGVFNHTGDDSVYFNKHGRYGDGGAYRDKNSPYHSWYSFTRYPDSYDSWWGIEILPRLCTSNPAVEEYLAGEYGIAAKYLKKGVAGLRLDVADELPDSFLERLNKTAKGVRKDAVIIGEVWENAADKCAYGKRRKYFRGSQLDGVMNYPIKEGIVSFVKTGDAQSIKDAVCDIYSSYPFSCSLSLMNIVGTHDTERILTVLGTDRYKGMCGDELKNLVLSQEELEDAKEKLLCASVLQFTLPGVPSIYYGDEAGAQGGRDPFCRMPFPWGRENKDITKHYKKLCEIRRKEKALCSGEIESIDTCGCVFCFTRCSGGEKITVCINMGKNAHKLPLEENDIVLYGANAEKGEKAVVLNERAFVIVKHE